MQVRVNEKPYTQFIGVMLFALLAIAGLSYVKWMPYSTKAFFAQSHHAIGNSILAGNAASAPPASWNAATDYAVAYGKSIWQALVLGLLLGSGIKVLLPGAWVSSMLGRMGFKSVMIGGIFALPSMMCTCCAAPVAIGMRQSRASVDSVVSWWMSNPVLNPATLVFMGFVLGWGWMLFRLVIGVAMVLGVAYLAERYTSNRESVTVTPEFVQEAAPQGGFMVRWIKEFTTLAIRLVPEYLVLVLFLGAARVWLFPVLGVHGGFLWIIAMALAGTLFVIPTAGEVPIVQAIFALGMGAGPAGALIMTLPAVSLPSLVMLGRAFTLRTRLVIASGVVLSGIAAGLVAMAVF